MSNTSTKSNKQFMILSAISIILVVDCHAQSPFFVMANIMPYNSFLMPLFAFISGYFFHPGKLNKLSNYLLAKARSLFVPFLIWNLTYGILVNCLKYCGLIRYGEPLSFHTLFIEPFLGCFMFQINSPSWYVPIIFILTVSYAICRKILGRLWNDWLITPIAFLLGMACVYFARHGYNSNPFYLVIQKIGFFLPFYQFGYFYKQHLENAFKKIPRLLLLFLPVAINSILLYITHDLNFLDIATMSGFLNDYYFIPFITSLSGIFFWLTVSDMVEPIWGDNKLINYISNHTFTIMMHHILFFNLYNLLLAALTKISLFHIPIDFEAFRSTAWYRYEPLWQCNVWYVFFGVTGPLIFRYLYDRVKNFLNFHYTKKGNLGQNS